LYIGSPKATTECCYHENSLASSFSWLRRFR